MTTQKSIQFYQVATAFSIKWCVAWGATCQHPADRSAENCMLLSPSHAVLARLSSAPGSRLSQSWRDPEHGRREMFSNLEGAKDSASQIGFNAGERLLLITLT